MRLLIFNAGSSSLKFELLELAAPAVRRLAGGAFNVATDGSSGFLCTNAAGMRPELTRAGTLADAARAVLAWLADSQVHGEDCVATLTATVHRIVHGGARFSATSRLGAADLDALDAISDLAPLHNPPALGVIHAVRGALGEALPLIGVFDTAYYVSLPDSAIAYAVPQRWREQFGIRRYGFHGTAHRSLCEGARALLGPAHAPRRIVSLQLGRGCSVTATRDGQPVATSMGFTPLEGLVMGTRCGDLDPGALLYAMQRDALTPAAALRELNGASGLLGLSGRSADMRELAALEKSGEAAAALAIEVFCRSARHYLGAYIAELGGVEAIVFGGGIGENHPDIRRRILGELSFAGIALSEEANRAAIGTAANFAAPGSRSALLVIPVDEASVIAREAGALLQT